MSRSHPNPAQVQLSPSGTELLVTEKGIITDPSTGRIDIYHVAQDGSLSGPTSVPSVGAYPFGMAFDPAKRSEVLIDDGVTGAVIAYRLRGRANLRLSRSGARRFRKRGVAQAGHTRLAP